MLLFNAFQIAVLYVAMPFIVQWLWFSNKFMGSQVLAGVGAIAYIVMFCMNVGMLYQHILEEFKRS